VAPSLTIRPWTSADAPFIRELGNTAFGEYDHNAGEYSESASARAATFVAERRESRVGFIVLQQSRDGSVHLAAIAVTEDARGLGVGAALVGAAEKHARAIGASRIDLTTADSNVAALSLFRRSGFRQKHGAEGTYQRGQRTVRLEKRMR
jgi:ribosomal protein S18 acetylase RimI-like enzyme